MKQATRIRMAHKRWPALTPAQIAKKLGVSDGAVRSALRTKHASPGRPLADHVTVRVSIPRSVYDLARAEAERDGIGIEHVLRAALVSGVVPPEQWTEQMERDRAPGDEKP